MIATEQVLPEGIMNTIRVVFFLLAILPAAISRPALALPAPKTEAEMMQLADLVVDAACVSIVCDGVPIVDPQKTTTKYVSTLWPSKSYKGGLPKSFQVRGYSEAWVGPPPIGGWHQGPIPKGWAGKLYLKAETDGTYTKVWWNAMTEDTVTSKPEALPSCATTDAGPAKLDSAPAKPDSAPAKLDGPAQPDSAAKVDSTPVTTDGAAKTDGPPAKTDLGPPASSDGCSCAVEPSSSPGPGLLCLLALALLTRRRRR
jgi:MYXO-CTERM domain-containing protein